MGAFRICIKYSLSGNEAIPSYPATERENASQEWNRPIPFYLILQPNTPLSPGQDVTKELFKIAPQLHEKGTLIGGEGWEEGLTVQSRIARSILMSRIS
jgi:hypothetical protein